MNDRKQRMEDKHKNMEALKEELKGINKLIEDQSNVVDINKTMEVCIEDNNKNSETVNKNIETLSQKIDDNNKIREEIINDSKQLREDVYKRQK